MEDQLIKAQRDMMEQFKKTQQDRLGQITQMLGFKLPEPEGASVVNHAANPIGENENPTYPPGFTPPHFRAQTDPRVILSRGKTQLHHAGASSPINLPSASEVKLGGNEAENFVSKMDQLIEIEKPKIETSKEIEDRCKRLEEKMKAIEVVDIFVGLVSMNLSLSQIWCYLICLKS
ncbi:hypothetical protein HRI_003130700 [Hibiscus trionum]|uniref:Uncharacterized protein n=1 Tax=Hibiscus trionum TaxID=183268 RepID=A0A9W7IEK2_HIBTR|nr:hypothetical protein HRI_003130700 [Hibiscus trionum]